MRRSTRPTLYPLMLPLLFPLALVAACANPTPSFTATSVSTPSKDLHAQILLGRQLVISHDCGGCHGGGDDPTSERWLNGSHGPDDDFKIGTFTTRPKNLTPDNLTGIGSFSERQIFNALRYGLRPEETPDLEITSTTPGKGNFPLHPHYLAPPMPWPGWRHMSDEQLYAIATYLKNGVKPSRNQVQDSEGPPDFWASTWGDGPGKIGRYPAPPYPTAAETGR